MTYTVKEHVNEYEQANAQTCINGLVKLLNAKEISDNDVEFCPTYITSCRTLHVMELDDIIKRMKQLYKQDQGLE